MAVIEAYTEADTGPVMRGCHGKVDKWRFTMNFRFIFKKIKVLGRINIGDRINLVIKEVFKQSATLRFPQLIQAVI